MTSIYMYIEYLLIFCTYSLCIKLLFGYEATITSTCKITYYFGYNFEGYEVNKFLENTSKLREVVDENLHIFIDCIQYTCMDSLQAMKLSCFGCLKINMKVLQIFTVKTRRRSTIAAAPYFRSLANSAEL